MNVSRIDEIVALGWGLSINYLEKRNEWQLQMRRIDGKAGYFSRHFKSVKSALLAALDVARSTSSNTADALPVCDCGKACWPSEAEAEAEAVRLTAKNIYKSTAKLGVRHYHCDLCGRWHVSSMSAPPVVASGQG